MPTPKRKSHRVVLDLTFDKPCSGVYARREARACLMGQTFYTADNYGEPAQPGTFKVRSVKREEG